MHAIHNIGYGIREQNTLDGNVGMDNQLIYNIATKARQCHVTMVTTTTTMNTDFRAGDRDPR